MLKWYEQNTSDCDVVISSRIRLARNLETYSFSSRLAQEQASAFGQ